MPPTPTLFSLLWISRRQRSLFQTNNMPEYYADWWWEEMPPRAQKAAQVLGWTKATWDADEDVAYESKAFADCTVQEKHAAMYLGMNPIDEKLDIWWSETDDETKAHAAALGWDQHKWDDDWAIQDLPCEHIYWKDLSDEQKDAAIFFGYSRSLWDETDDDDDEEFEVAAASVKPPKKQSSKPQQEEKEEEGDYESEASEGEANGSSKPAKAKIGNQKKKIVVSKAFGGSGGGAFDHKNNRKVSQITVWANGNCVNSLAVKYVGSLKKAGDNTDGEESVLTLQSGEYVNAVTVRANNLVQCLTFKTNKGNTLGPCGGKGWPRARINKDHEGPESTVYAPKGYMLCGIMGGAGVHLDRIAFRWGPVPDSMKNQ